MPRQYGQVLDIQDYNPYVFQGTTIAPKLGDVNLLAQSIKDREQRQAAAIAQKATLNKEQGEIRKQFYNNPEMQGWLDEKFNQMNAEVDGLLQAGEFGEAMRRSVTLGAEFAQDRERYQREAATTEYKEKLKEVDDLVKSKRISEDTRQWWLKNNQFKYENIYDKDGNLVGGTSYSDMEVPVDDIDISDFTFKAFKLVTENRPYSAGSSNYRVTNQDGTGFQNTRQYISKKEILENLDEILNLTPAARQAVWQRYQVELEKYKELEEQYKANPQNVDLATRYMAQKKILGKGQGVANFEDYIANTIGTNAVANNLAYDYKTEAYDYQQTKKGSGYGDEEDDINSNGNQQSPQTSGADKRVKTGRTSVNKS